jgi:PLP dependent protein
VLDSAALRARLADVRDSIERAAARARRNPSGVRLVAVSKTFSAQCVRAAAEAGVLDFGENKVQEGLQKMADTSDLPIHWHLIGHLQSNKARKAAQFHSIHSIDTASLLRRVDEAAVVAGRHVDVLLQVDLAREPTKHGALPDEVMSIVHAARECQAVRMRGLMVLPPGSANPEASRPYFSRLRQLRDQLLSSDVAPEMLTEMSMGMSHDFEIAVEEGATMVRLGSAIFGERTYG